jgi:hypothetical protein
MRRMSLLPRGLVIVALAGLIVLPALAQNPPATTTPPAATPPAATPPATTPVRVRGAVDKLDGNTLTVKPKDGQNLTIKLADNFTVTALVKKTVADIKANDFVASTGLKGTDGKLHCVELRIFPAAVPAIEGQFPWDSMPDSTMTNATVTGITTGTDGELLKVSYKGTDSEFVAGPDCQVFANIPGDASLLKPGAAIFTVAQKAADGTLTAARITAEKDGIKPPM